MALPNEETIVTAAMCSGLAELTIRQPAGTFALTPGSLISLQAIGKHRDLLTGNGLDWGSGTGCLAIAAAKIPAVQHVIGLEIVEANVTAACENAQRNGVQDRVSFLLSDSYMPRHPAGRASLEELRGRVNVILANPHSSEGDDGFGCRRLVLQGARRFLIPGGVVFLMVSIQYGQERLRRLCAEAPGFVHGGELASTDWVPFDLARPDRMHNLRLYVAEERRGGLAYDFRHPDRSQPERSQPAGMTAQAALAHYGRTGESPLTRWEVHLFSFRPAS
ncbi:MAG: methyltransferase [Planctomycetes bacterium]|nr:methyltransferase [Planctomycetota bacterium]